MIKRFDGLFMALREHPVRLVVPLVLGLLTFGVFTVIALAVTGILGREPVELPDESALFDNA